MCVILFTGGVSGTPQGPGTSPRTRYTSQDQVHPPRLVTPPRPGTPQDQVHPPRPGTPQDQVHPPRRGTPSRPGTPQDQVHPPRPDTPRPGTPPQDQVLPLPNTGMHFCLISLILNTKLGKHKCDDGDPITMCHGNLCLG